MPTYRGLTGLSDNTLITGLNSSPAWGTIVGTVSDQEDLQLELDSKSDTTHLHTGVYALAAHTHEGTEVLATGVTDGFVLTADGLGGSVWEASSGGGVVTSPLNLTAASPEINLIDTGTVDSNYEIKNSSGSFTLTKRTDADGFLNTPININEFDQISFNAATSALSQVNIRSPRIDLITRDAILGTTGGAEAVNILGDVTITGDLTVSGAAPGVAQTTGSFTVASLTGGTSGSVTMGAGGNQTLEYIKIGNLVTIQGALGVSSNTATGSFATFTLPFSTANNSEAQMGTFIWNDFSTGDRNVGTLFLSANTTSAEMYLTGTATTWLASVGGTDQFWFSFSYISA